MINRLILWISLAGMVLAVHLWIQKARGFDQGCLGIETHAVAPTEAGCNDANLQAGSHLFGVSNAAWGYAFYFGLAVLSFGKIVTTAAWSRRLHALGEIGVLLAFLYSGYLLYFQAFVAGAFCVLCLTSIGLITALLVLHAMLRWRGGHQPVSGDSRVIELGFAGGALFAAVGALVGVLVFVNRLGTRSLDEGNGAIEMRRIVGRMLPAYLDPQKMQDFRACHFDGMAPPIDVEKIIGPSTPFVGKAGGLPVILFIDPHCPHCRQIYPLFMRLAEKFGDRARFYVLPRVIWDYSIPAAAALKLAEPSGKYFDLWKLELKPRRTPLTVADLAGFHTSLGLPVEDLAGRLEAVRPQVIADRKRAVNAGVDSVPAFFIGGRKVFYSDQSEECLATLIESSLAMRPARAAGQE